MLGPKNIDNNSKRYSSSISVLCTRMLLRHQATCVKGTQKKKKEKERNKLVENVQAILTSLWDFIHHSVLVWHLLK